MSNIEKKKDAIKRRIKKAEQELADLQEICKHTVAIKRHGSNTGNYDPHADCYWTDFHCPECDKRWRVNGSV
jgi:hypothetical protein